MKLKSLSIFLFQYICLTVRDEHYKKFVFFCIYCKGEIFIKELYLYIHIPFCIRKCNYCSFYSITDLNRIDEYVEAVCRAIKTFDFSDYVIHSIYFGGGTPSLLKEKLLLIVEEIYRCGKVSPNAEITFEANPATLNQQTLSTLYSGGFNRISIGIQDSDNGMLKTMGRLHNFTDGIKAVEMSKNAGFRNISCDIILATPNQTVEKAVNSVEHIISQDIQHISAYLLNIEKGTEFYTKNVGENCPNEDETANIYLNVCKILRKNGFNHYEISNFAKSGFNSIHNTAYWKLKNYLGIGPAAYSFVNKKRFSFENDINKFIYSKNVWDDIIDDGIGGDFEEYLMLSLRLNMGFDIDYAQRVYDIKTEKILPIIKKFEQANLVNVNNNMIGLTDEGFLLSNSIITEILNKL